MMLPNLTRSIFHTVEYGLAPEEGRNEVRPGLKNRGLILSQPDECPCKITIQDR
jgi:hypothetical protein